MKRQITPRPDPIENRRLLRIAAIAATGAGLLGASFRSTPGSSRFYALTVATATTWAAGGLLTRPPSGRPSPQRRPVLAPAALGVAAFAPFYGCALVSRRIPPLNRLLTSVLTYATQGKPIPILATTLVNGAAEEMFFRGTLYNAFSGRAPATASTGLYALSTAATRNPMLILAATVMGALFARQRRTTGSIQAPIITHLVWSTLMLRLLPPLFPPTPHDHPAPPCHLGRHSPPTSPALP